MDREVVRGATACVWSGSVGLTAGACLVWWMLEAIARMAEGAGRVAGVGPLQALLLETAAVAFVVSLGCLLVLWRMEKGEGA